jgi:hypothetical protein
MEVVLGGQFLKGWVIKCPHAFFGQECGRDDEKGDDKKRESGE